MKANIIVTCLFSIVTISQQAFSTIPRKLPDDEPPRVAMVALPEDDAQDQAHLVATAPVVPRGPRDVLRDYELEMASIAGQLSTDLGAISNAVGTGKITREQGEYVSGERYQIAIMQFQLFSALHAMLEADIARTPAAPEPATPEPAPSIDSERVTVAMPFSSLHLNPSLVEYLALKPTQVRSIQRLMDEERPKTAPLMLELRTVSAELGAAVRQGQSNDGEGVAQTLAARQARLLKQLTKSNSRLQRRIDDVLNLQQRKKLDAYKRTGDVRVEEGN